MRPDFIPVCKLHKVLAVNPSTAWRRASAGAYGPITRDDSGRQQVEAATVERVEGIAITDNTLKTVAAPRTYTVQGPRLRTVPIKIPTNAASLTPDDVKALIEAHLLVRDAQWRRFLARVDDATAEILESQAIFAGDRT
ncbi:MAG TPA: hypothetical protein VHD59_06860 [Pseudolabrys sp.]|nr:hypothetical protein [Pseudolabrys sp.]